MSRRFLGTLRRTSILLVGWVFFFHGARLACAAGPMPAPQLLGGLQPLDDALRHRWCWSGAWNLPVGDTCAFGRSTERVETGYVVNRGVETRADGSFSHRGADLCNRLPGGTVRAAAAGVVILATSQATGGYGARVIVAHRIPNEGIVYTVYAHLQPRSILVADGEVVTAGQPLGKVGRSGNASTDHLHFEVRVPRDPGVRWEKADPVDPVVFVAARRSSRCMEDEPLRPYLTWADGAALLEPGARAAEPLSRRAWWRMLALTAMTLPDSIPGPLAMRDSLDRAGILSDTGPPSGDPVSRDEWTRNLDRLRSIGAGLPAWSPKPTPVGALDHQPPPVSETDTVTIGEACVALFDLCAARASETIGLHHR